MTDVSPRIKGMSADALEAALDELALTQLDFARLLRVNGRTVRRWVAGEVEIPTLVGLFIRLLMRAPITGDRGFDLAYIDAELASMEEEHVQ